MRKQIAKIQIPYNGTWKVIETDSPVNPYRVYRQEDGHTRLIEKYGDIASCLHCITQQLTGHVWTMTEQRVERI